MGNPVPILFARRTLMYVVNIMYLERLEQKRCRKKQDGKRGENLLCNRPQRHSGGRTINSSNALDIIPQNEYNKSSEKRSRSYASTINKRNCGYLGHIG